MHVLPGNHFLSIRKLFYQQQMSKASPTSFRNTLIKINGFHVCNVCIYPYLVHRHNSCFFKEKNPASYQMLLSAQIRFSTKF